MGDKKLTLSSDNHNGMLVEGLWQLFTTQRGVDFDFGCRGVSRVHRLLLDVFISPSKLCRCRHDHQNEPPPLVEERDRSHLETTLEFLYKGRVVVCEEDLDGLLEFAKGLDFKLMVDAVLALSTACRNGDGGSSCIEIPDGNSSGIEISDVVACPPSFDSHSDGGSNQQWNFQVPDTFVESKDIKSLGFEESFGGGVCTPVHLVSTSMETEPETPPVESGGGRFQSVRDESEGDVEQPSGSGRRRGPATRRGYKAAAAAGRIDGGGSDSAENTGGQLEYIKSMHGNDLLVHSGYLFSRERLFGDKVFWSCVESKRNKCPGRCHTTGGVVTKYTDNHNHVPDAGKIGARRVMDSVKQRALNSGEALHQVITDATATVSPAFSAHLPSVSLMRRTLQRARQMHSGVGRESYPNPGGLRELEVPREFQETTTGEPFLLFDSGAGDDRMLLFATASNLQLLTRCDRWYCDGTFRATPPLFAHLFTVHGVRHPNVVPCVYALLPDRTDVSFGRLFAALNRLQPGLRPSYVTAGFDLTAVNAIREVYPMADLRGCFFHLSQVMWRHVQSIDGMQARYTSDPDFALQVRLLTALAFVPAAHVQEAFEALMISPYYLRERRTLQPLLDYFEDTWVGRMDKRTPPLFFHSFWNCYDTIGQGSPATNSAVEAWHRGFDKVVDAGRLNMWKFLSGLKQEQSANQGRIETLLSGQELMEPRRKYRDCSKQIVKVVEDYGRRHLIDYLTAVANTLSLSV